MKTAQVLDFKLGALRRTVEGDKTAAQPAGIFADMADGIEAVHQLAACADFSEPVRGFVLALASAAKSDDSDRVELFDEELAELMGCSARTVQRRRADYKVEASRSRFSPVEIIEGIYNVTEKKFEPTLYHFAVAAPIEQIVTVARGSEGFDTATRKAQRAAIKRAAAERFRTIPDVRTKARKQRRSRQAAAEIETCKKIIRTKFESLKGETGKLPEAVREQLMNPAQSGDLLAWWLDVRAEMDSFFGLDSAQPVDRAEDNRHTRQSVGYPPPAVSGIPPVVADAPAETGQESEPVVALSDLNTVTTSPPDPVYEPDAAAVAAWDAMEEKLLAPQVRSVNVPLTVPGGRASAATGPPQREVLEL